MNFWQKIRNLYRRITAPFRRHPSAPPIPTSQPVVPPPVAPPVGPLDTATKLDRIYKAGRAHVHLRIKYDGVERLVEPYSMRDRSTGRQFYGWCTIHGKIHSFILEKIESIEVTDIQFSPRWPVEF